MKQEARLGSRPIVVCIAGFGDNSSMFDGLRITAEADRIDFVPVDLPGFGTDSQAETNLEAMAGFVLNVCRERGARTLMAHSVASIIASLAAEKSQGDIENIVSLEGNLTADDAYFSGTAADFDNPIKFQAAFLERLSGNDGPIIAAYRDRVALADANALWKLGCDARKFSTKHSPGDLLMRSARILYLHNPKNCPEASIAWLEKSGLENTLLEGASHWPTVDQPDRVAALTEQFLMS